MNETERRCGTCRHWALDVPRSARTRERCYSANPDADAWAFAAQWAGMISSDGTNCKAWEARND